jgi:hypothetical protein
LNAEQESGGVKRLGAEGADAVQCGHVADVKVPLAAMGASCRSNQASATVDANESALALCEMRGENAGAAA